MHSAAPSTADSPPFGRNRCPSQPLLYDNNARMANRANHNAHALDVFRPRNEAQVLLLPSRRGPPRTSSQPPNATSQPQFAPPGAGPMAPAMLVAAAQPMAAAARARPPMRPPRRRRPPRRQRRRRRSSPSRRRRSATTLPPPTTAAAAARRQPLRRRPLDVLGQVAGPLEAVESFGHELHRQEITSVRQLQRACRRRSGSRRAAPSLLTRDPRSHPHSPYLQAKIGQQTRGAVPSRDPISHSPYLQAKIGQQTRGAVPIFRVFQRLDRRRVGLVDAGDLHAALETFNLEAPDELVSQLVTSLDLDHDGALCLSEFVAGFKEGNRQGCSSDRRKPACRRAATSVRVPWNHPIHNAAEAIMPSNTLAFLGGS